MVNQTANENNASARKPPQQQEAFIQTGKSLFDASSIDDVSFELKGIF